MKLIFIIVLIVSAVFLYQQYQKRQEWTLMVCSSTMSNGSECYDNSYEIPGFRSKQECLLEGISRFDKQGFECARNCRKELGDLNVCSEVCNKSGCHE